MFNHRYWGAYFDFEYSTYLDRLVETLERRLLPTFDDLQKEAADIQDAEWDRQMGLPSDGSEDGSISAERAFEAGFSHYSTMVDIRQSLLNIYAAALYHAWEQQVLEFHRREILEPSEQNEIALLTRAEFSGRLKAVGIDVEQFKSWPQIKELQLLANTVKHADGSSAEKLKKLRPDLFEHPDLLKDFGELFAGTAKRVYKPFGGADIYVSIKDLKNYCSSLKSFWGSLGESLSKD